MPTYVWKKFRAPDLRLMALVVGAGAVVIVVVVAGVVAASGWAVEMDE
jgi:hypothetical protein